MNNSSQEKVAGVHDLSLPYPKVSLFRAEAVCARTDSWLGKAIVLQPIGVRWSSGIALLSVVLIAAFLIFGQYTRRVRLVGVVMPSTGIVRLLAPNTGRIMSLAALEGASVLQGQELYSIGFDTTTSLGETQALTIAQLRKQRDELVAEIERHQRLNLIEKSGLLKQSDGVSQELEQTITQIKTTEKYSIVLQNVSEKYSLLAKQHIVLERQAFDRLESFMRTTQDVERLKREATQLKQRLAEIQAKLNGFDLRSLSIISEIQRQISVLDRELGEVEAKRVVTVTAPRPGTITGVLAQPGQFIAAGMSLLSIVPDDAPLEIQLFGSSSIIGFMRENAAVMIRYAAFPYQKFGLYPGTVTSFSRTTLRPSDIEPGTPVTVQSASPQPEGNYRIIVHPQYESVLAYGKNEPIRPGMAVEAEVFLDSRRLYEWIFEPIFSIRGVLIKGGQSYENSP